MSQQPDERPQPRPRLVFSQEVNEEIQRLYDRAVIEHRTDAEAALQHVVDWFYQNPGRETAAARAFRQLADHFVKSALAQGWIDRIQGELRVENVREPMRPDR